MLRFCDGLSYSGAESAEGEGAIGRKGGGGSGDISAGCLTPEFGLLCGKISLVSRI